jgi:lipopolysaccharide/colanic/teichoic acid biosynthesis glycosyltransferase
MQPKSNSRYLLVKRLMDIVISLSALALLMPLLALLGLIICLDSPGSPLLMQERVGRGGYVFKMVKLRSMIEEAKMRGPYWTVENDPRITRVGRLIRRTSLDELPQLWNVLVGDMSLIGPRPDLPAQEQLYLANAWKKRYQVKPGISGLAQVSGRSNLTPKRRLAYDLLYAARPTFRMDVYIAVKTIWSVVNRIGVN